MIQSVTSVEMLTCKVSKTSRFFRKVCDHDVYLIFQFVSDFVENSGILFHGLPEALQEVDVVEPEDEERSCLARNGRE